MRMSLGPILMALMRPWVMYRRIVFGCTPSHAAACWMDSLAGSVSVVAALMRLENHAAKGVNRMRGQGRNLLARCDVAAVMSYMSLRPGRRSDEIFHRLQLGTCRPLGLQQKEPLTWVDRTVLNFHRKRSALLLGSASDTHTENHEQASRDG